ncbi:Uncharacterised protein [Chlamydia trachomatis]|nr:Uncharacterised protein [Chlamydia trachomatis]
MEKFVESLIFIRNKLNIVNKKHIDIAELIFERVHLLISKCVNKPVGKFFAGNVQHFLFWIESKSVVSYCVQEMSFPHS